MKISSPEFLDGDFIPAKFTCEGSNVNPEFIIENIPEGAKTLSLIADDTDSPSRIFVHWVLFNIPVSKKIEEATQAGTRGINNAGHLGYTGPCPAPGKAHHYRFKIFALDKKLKLDEGADKPSLLKAMGSRIIDQAELTGLYKR